MKDYLDVLNRRRNVVVVFFLATVLVAAVGSVLMEPVYRASATLLIDAESPNILTTSGAVELGSQGYYAYKDYLQTQMEVIISRPVLRQVFEELHLAAAREYSRARDPLRKFLKTISVEPLRDTRLIKLRAENKDPAVAAKIANRIAEIYVTRNLTYISKTELLNLLKNEYLKLEGKLSEYAKIYKADHPEMIQLKQEIGEVVGKIEREKTLISSYGEQSRGAPDTYRVTLEGLKANNVSIIEAADVPVVPIKPRKALNVLLAVLLGVFGGAGLAFFFEYLDDTVKDIEEIERLANVPILGTVPEISRDRKTAKSEKETYVSSRPTDPISEAYRSFRTNIFFSTDGGRQLKNLVLTSPGPAEGKTLTLCNLGIAIAQSSKKVLLVDGDMRKPRLHEIFGKENKRGLSHFLCGQVEFDGLAQKTGIENLSLVVSGTIPSNPAELLAARRLQEFIARAAECFDLVIFDTPPIGILTDAALIGRVTDGMILVIESGKTSRRGLARISRLMKDAKIKVLGIFLNKIPLTSRNQYYYYHSYARRYSGGS